VWYSKETCRAGPSQKPIVAVTDITLLLSTAGCSFGGSGSGSGSDAKGLAAHR
jgi:hypothetical protein